MLRGSSSWYFIGRWGWNREDNDVLAQDFPVPKKLQVQNQHLPFKGGSFANINTRRERFLRPANLGHWRMIYILVNN